MVLVGELALYIGCMGLSAIVTRITILSCFEGDDVLPETQGNGYTLIEDSGSPSSFIEFSSEFPETANLFGPLYQSSFSNKFENQKYSTLNSVKKRIPPISANVINFTESIDLDESFVTHFKSLSEDSEESDEEKVKEKREFAPVLDLDASTFDGFDKSTDLYHVKEYYYALARERLATEIL